VRKIFMNKRVGVNSRECLSRDNNGHASDAYNSVGKQLCDLATLLQISLD